MPLPLTHMGVDEKCERQDKHQRPSTEQDTNDRQEASPNQLEITRAAPQNLQAHTLKRPPAEISVSETPHATRKTSSTHTRKHSNTHEPRHAPGSGAPARPGSPAPERRPRTKPRARARRAPSPTGAGPDENQARPMGAGFDGSRPRRAGAGPDGSWL